MTELHAIFGELRAMSLHAPTSWDEISAALLPYEDHPGFLPQLVPYCRDALGGRRDCPAHETWIWDAIEGTLRPILSVCTQLTLPQQPRNIGPQDLKRLVENHDLRLRDLNLSGQDLGTHGMEVLSASTQARESVEHLSIEDADLDAASLRALLLRPWPRLTTLALSNNPLRDLSHLVTCDEALPRLTTLKVVDCDLSDAALVGMSAAYALPSLTHIRMDGFLYDETAQALAASEALAGLHLTLQPRMWCALSQASLRILEDADIRVSPWGRIRWTPAQERGRQERRRRDDGARGRRRRRRRR